MLLDGSFRTHSLRELKIPDLWLQNHVLINMILSLFCGERSVNAGLSIYSRNHLTSTWPLFSLSHHVGYRLRCAIMIYYHITIAFVVLNVVKFLSVWYTGSKTLHAIV